MESKIYRKDPPCQSVGIRHTSEPVENENATKVRLIKVKEMVLEQAHSFK